MARPADTYHLRLKAARRLAGLSQTAAAKLGGMTEDRLQRIERGRGPVYASDMLSLSVAYGVTIGQLYGLAPIEVD